MHITGFLPQSFCDWPKKSAAVLFLTGCNFRCGFCHNAQLIDFKTGENNEEPVLAKLADLAWSLDGVVISGGEPTVHADLPQFIERVKKLGLKIKLDTNGSNPLMLKELVDKKLLDYIAMDLKTNFDKYSTLAKYGETGNIRDSIGIIIGSGVDHEFRTTYVPGVMTKEDIVEAVELIKGAKRYSLQKFVPRDCLDSAFNALKSPSVEELQSIAKELEFSGEIRIRGEHKETVFKKADKK
jgi:pyruvate formate lyase activating enzyme